MEGTDQPPAVGDGGSRRLGLAPTAPRRRSWAWFLLPVFVDVIGGALAYWALRHDSPRLARDCLYVGITLTAVKAVTMAGTALALSALGGSLLPWDAGTAVSIGDPAALEGCLEGALGLDGTAASIDRDVAVACLKEHALGPSPAE